MFGQRTFVRRDIRDAARAIRLGRRSAFCRRLKLRNFVFGVLATVAIAVLCAYLVVRSGLIPANADGKPFQLENWAATTSLDATLAREAPKGLPPEALTNANLIAGVKLYGQHCAICHG